MFPIVCTVYIHNCGNKVIFQPTQTQQSKSPVYLMDHTSFRLIPITGMTLRSSPEFFFFFYGLSMLLYKMISSTQGYKSPLKSQQLIWLMSIWMQFERFYWFHLFQRIAGCLFFRNSANELLNFGQRMIELLGERQGWIREGATCLWRTQSTVRVNNNNNNNNASYHITYFILVFQLYLLMSIINFILLFLKVLHLALKFHLPSFPKQLPLLVKLWTVWACVWLHHSSGNILDVTAHRTIEEKSERSERSYQMCPMVCDYGWLEINRYTQQLCTPWHSRVHIPWIKMILHHFTSNSSWVSWARLVSPQPCSAHWLVETRE